MMTSIRPALFLTTLALTAIPACGTEPLPMQAELDASRAAWADVQTDIGDSYSYTRQTTGSELGVLETTITVEAGEVVYRYVEHRSWDGEILASVSEEGPQIGVSDLGHDPLTLDALYDLCETDVLPGAAADADLQLTFTTFDDGLLERCFTIDTGIEDASEHGVSLIRLETEPLPCGAGVLPCG